MDCQQLISNLLKHLINIRSSFGTRLKENAVVCLRKFLPLLVGHLFLIILIRFCPHENPDRIRNRRVLVNILHPLVEVFKSLPVAQTK